MMRIPRSFFLLCLFFFSGSLNAQNNCALKLKEAQESYTAGQIEKVPELLKNCIRSGFTREEKLIAYKLMINSFIFDNEYQLADEYMMMLLGEFPYYRPTSADPILFNTLYNGYDNRPRYSLGVSTGINSSSIQVIEHYGVQDLNTVQGKYSSTELGFQAGLVFSRFLTRKIEMGFEPKYMQIRYNYKISPFSFSVIDYSELQNSLLLPLTFSLGFTNNRLDPYLEAGFATRFLSSAKSNLQRSYQNTNGQLFNDIKSPENDISFKRKQINLSASIGAGIRYQIPVGQFFTEVTYYQSFMNEVVKSSRTPANDDLSLIYYYTDNDFRVNLFTLSIGFCYSFYKPKKI